MIDNVSRSVLNLALEFRPDRFLSPTIVENAVKQENRNLRKENSSVRVLPTEFFPVTGANFAAPTIIAYYWRPVIIIGRLSASSYRLSRCWPFRERVAASTKKTAVFLWIFPRFPFLLIRSSLSVVLIYLFLFPGLLKGSSKDLGRPRGESETVLAGTHEVERGFAGNC